MKFNKSVLNRILIIISLSLTLTIYNKDIYKSIFSFSIILLTLFLIIH